MPRKIDYYFSLQSPWAYIGHAPFMEIAQRHGVEINYKPVFLGRVFAETGGLPLAQRHPARQRYRLVELQRWRERRGPLLQSPAETLAVRRQCWPTAASSPWRSRATIPTRSSGSPMRRSGSRSAISAISRCCSELAKKAGLDAASVLQIAQGSTAEAFYAINLENAVAADVFGSPAYVLDGEVFWGQDRLELLDDALKSGRPAYRPDASRETAA